MKRIFISLMVMLTIAVSANAMGYNQARREALFLTDKMAYELNLTPEQCDAAYEINLDYLMGVTSVDDVFSTYWTRRNLDLSYILFDWQWNAFRSATYFYKPLYWDAGYWHFGIYARYPHRHYYYFDRPTVYVSYRGGHGWRANGGRSFYYDRRNDFRRQSNELGMRDRWDRGDFGGARNVNGSQSSSFGNRVQGNGNSKIDGNQSSGTFNGARNTVVGVGNIRNSSSNGNQSNGSFSGARSTGIFSSSANRGLSTSRVNGSSNSSQSRTSGSFGTNRGSVSTTVPSRSASSITSGSFGGSRNSGSFSGSFGTNRGSVSTSAPSRPASSSTSGSFGGSRSGGSFSGSGSAGGGSVQRGSFGGQR